MNSWEVIRRSFCEDTTVGSIRRKVALNTGASLFFDMDRLGCLADADEAVDSFRKDDELSDALLIRSQLEDMGMLTQYSPEGGDKADADSGLITLKSR